MIHHAQYKRFEFVILYAIMPLLFFLNIIPIEFLVPVLFALGVYALFVLKATHHEDVHNGFKKEELLSVLGRFVIIGVVFVGLSYFLYQDTFFNLLRNEPKVFLALIIFYPLISVMPQELLYRQFFFNRYSFKLKMSSQVMLNALLFMWGHIVFENSIVLLLTLIAGVLFAQTYLKSRSLLLVCVEHTLYGYLVFASGLGELFFHTGTLDTLRMMFS